jgi:hypothetical protein
VTKAARLGERWVPKELCTSFVSLMSHRSDAATTIQGAIETYVVQSPIVAQLISSAVTKALGDERARELHGLGADMDWGQAVAYTLTQTTQALSEPGSAAQP